MIDYDSPGYLYVKVDCLLRISKRSLLTRIRSEIKQSLVFKSVFGSLGGFSGYRGDTLPVMVFGVSVKTSYDPIEGGLQKLGFATKISPSTVFKVTGSIFRLLFMF